MSEIHLWRCFADICVFNDPWRLCGATVMEGIHCECITARDVFHVVRWVRQRRKGIGQNVKSETLWGLWSLLSLSLGILVSFSSVSSFQRKSRGWCRSMATVKAMVSGLGFRPLSIAVMKATCEAVEILKLQQSCSLHSTCILHKLLPYHSIPFDSRFESFTQSNHTADSFKTLQPDVWSPLLWFHFFVKAFYRAAAMNALQLLLQQQMGGWLSLSCFVYFLYLFFRNLASFFMIFTAAKAVCPLRRLMACDKAARKRKERVRESYVQSLPGNSFLYFQPRGSAFSLVVFDPFH